MNTNIVRLKTRAKLRIQSSGVLEIVDSPNPRDVQLEDSVVEDSSGVLGARKSKSKSYPKSTKSYPKSTKSYPKSTKLGTDYNLHLYDWKNSLSRNQYNQYHKLHDESGDIKVTDRNKANNWFNSMSKDQQNKYLELHPHSNYARFKSESINRRKEYHDKFKDKAKTALKTIDDFLGGI